MYVYSKGIRHLDQMGVSVLLRGVVEITIVNETRGQFRQEANP